MRDHTNGPDKTNDDQSVRLQCPLLSLRTKAPRLSPRQASLFPCSSPAQNVTVQFILTEKSTLSAQLVTLNLKEASLGTFDRIFRLFYFILLIYKYIENGKLDKIDRGGTEIVILQNSTDLQYNTIFRTTVRALVTSHPVAKPYLGTQNVR